MQGIQADLHLKMIEQYKIIETTENDKLLNKIQQFKMKELWDNTEDSEWEILNNK